MSAGLAGEFPGAKFLGSCLGIRPHRVLNLPIIAECASDERLSSNLVHSPADSAGQACVRMYWGRSIRPALPEKRLLMNIIG